MQLFPDAYHEIASFLDNPDIYSLMQTGREISTITSRYLQPTIADLARAIDNGDLEAVRSLLKYQEIDPSFDHGLFLKCAALKGRLGVVQVLLQDPRVDPTLYNNAALRYALRKNHTDVVNLLLADPRVASTYQP